MKNYTGAYVINLEANEDRKALFLKGWNNLVADKINVVKAVDTRGHLWKNYKQHISKEAYKNLEETVKSKKRNSHEILSEGAVGCFLTHLKCWRRFLKESTSENDYCLIFEDDSSIPKDLFETTSNIVEGINTEWGMILLGWQAPSQPSSFNEYLLTPGSFWQTHAYLLSSFGARKILDVYDEVNMPVDVFLSKNIKKFKIFGTINNICVQENTCGYTDIQIHINPP